MNAIQYRLPVHWVKYDEHEIFRELTDAKAAILALQTIPFQRRWVEELQQMQLKMEIAGTTQIEGADFSGNELEVAIRAENPEQLFTRSQRQATAATKAFRLISSIPADKPVNEELMCAVHSLIVTDCDDDRCAPGRLRGPDSNVTFGKPRHRGATGGEECKLAFEQLAKQVQTVFRQHDPLGMTPSSCTS